MLLQFKEMQAFNCTFKLVLHNYDEPPTPAGSQPQLHRQLPEAAATTIITKNQPN